MATLRGGVGSSVRARLAVSYPRLVAGTTGLTFALVLIGVWTAVGGYGLTCEAQWPFCDGAVFGLFPANWGSFVEWFHRLIAMTAGFAILGTALGAWLTGASRRVRAAATLALAVTPFQVVLGALTVTRYELLILAAHFGFAIVILTLLVATTVWAGSGADPRGLAAVAALSPAALAVPGIAVGASLSVAGTDAGVASLAGLALSGLVALGVTVAGTRWVASRLDRVAPVAAGALVAAVVLTPGVVVTAHSVPLHVGYYALALAGFVALLGAGLAARERTGRTATALLAGAAVAGLGLLVGRYTVVAGLGSLFGVVGAGRLAELGALVCLTVAAVLAVTATWLARRNRDRVDSIPSPGS